MILGGDVVLAEYLLVPGKDNFIMLEELSSDYRFMKGQFQVTYALKDRIDQATLLPDTIQISEGFFESVVRD
ncbi:MAG: hypothetical protein IPL46_14550 [Saprospiraceae bacterium]|nr:hypothetical protein [Saprospiraceae bacterium]